MIRILLIEDDPAISEITSYFLTAQPGYAVTCAHSGSEALAYAKGVFDIIIMDILLPDTNGIHLCATLRQWHHCPIIFSSALDDTDTIVHALQMGGDDFIVKPYDNKILLARIEANLRRVRMEAQRKPERCMTLGPFALDETTSQALLDGEILHLSQMEYRLLSWFMRHPGRYATAEEIYQALWGRESTGDARTVQVHIHNLRRKIEKDPSQPQYMKSVWGKGYIFLPEPPKDGSS